MPRDAKEVPICAPEKAECVDEAITIVEESAYDDNHETNTQCRCLPSCTDMEFMHETSVSKISKHWLLNLPSEVTGSTNSIPYVTNSAHLSTTCTI